MIIMENGGLLVRMSKVLMLKGRGGEGVCNIVKVISAVLYMH